jgi:hypothetical protein
MPPPLPFREIELSDKTRFREAVSRSLSNISDPPACEYTFGNNFIWRFPYKLMFADWKGFIIISCYNGREYYFPLGCASDNLVEIINDLIVESEKALVLRGMTDTNRLWLETNFPNRFDFTVSRDESDYIYLKTDLINLSGRQFHSKRNHIARFIDNNDWSFEPINKKNLDEAYEMAIDWCVKYGCDGNFGLEREFCAVKQAFSHFTELGFDGGLLRLNGRVIAVTAGERLGVNTYAIHIEKAYHDIQGAYQTVNREFAKTLPDDIVYINRGEDEGDEGLRKAKLSYHPTIILDKYKAKLICG